MARRIRLTLLLLAVAAAGCGPGHESGPADPPGTSEHDVTTASADPLVGGFREVVVSTADLEGSARYYREVGGWVELHRGPVDPRWASFWGLDPGTAIDEMLLGNPRDDTGHVRVRID